MKKLIILVLSAVILTWCIRLNSKSIEEYHSFYTFKVCYAPNGCEYYIYENYHDGIPIHKEDCKKCKARRKAELRKLVECIKTEKK